MSNQSTKKQDPVEAVIIGIFKAFAFFLKTVFYGIKKLKDVKLLIILLVFIITAAGAYIKRDLIFNIDAPLYIQWMIYTALLALPTLYLSALGRYQSKAAGEYDTIFADINFIGKDKKYPTLLFKKEDGKKEILVFRSNIPLETWKKATSQLETAFNCVIAGIEEYKDKKSVALTTIDSGHTLPTNIKWSDELIDPQDGVIVLGENIFGPVKTDLNKSAHILIGGTTGMGKSVEERNITWQLIKKGAIPYMFDFKGRVEFGKKYEKYGEVFSDLKATLEILTLIVKENELRLNLIYENEVKKITELNKCIGKKLSRIVIIFDEIAEALDKKGATKEECELIDAIIGRLSTIARQGRAPGISLVLATQRPDATILPGQVKNNLATRICGFFKDSAASEIVLGKGNTSATRLPKICGRFILSDDAKDMHIQGYYFDDDTMLGDIDVAEYIVLCPELAKRLVSSPTSATASSAPAQRQENPKLKPVNSKNNRNNAVKLDFDYRKAVNK